jgi:hypothetical protein
MGVAVTDLYFCSTAREVESATGGGFKVCCTHPERHIPMPDGPATAAVSAALSEAAKREYALEQHLQLLRVALAARGGDNLLTGLDMGPVETGPVQSIMLNHSALTHHGEMTVTQPNGVIVTMELPNVRFAEVKLANSLPDAPLFRQDYVLPKSRTLTITLEL